MSGIELESTKENVNDMVDIYEDDNDNDDYVNNAETQILRWSNWWSYWAIGLA